MASQYPVTCNNVPLSISVTANTQVSLSGTLQVSNTTFSSNGMTSQPIALAPQQPTGSFTREVGGQTITVDLTLTPASGFLSGSVLGSGQVTDPSGQVTPFTNIVFCTWPNNS